MTSKAVAGNASKTAGQVAKAATSQAAKGTADTGGTGAAKGASVKAGALPR